jgi:hypothetical protein
MKIIAPKVPVACRSELARDQPLFASKLAPTFDGLVEHAAGFVTPHFRRIRIAACLTIPYLNGDHVFRLLAST